MSKKYQTRPHRLSDDCYRGMITAAFTCCIRNKKGIFTNPDIVLQCSEILINESRNFDCSILVYLFMPDHCHILLQGKSENSDTLRFMRNFKQKSGYWLSKNHSGIEWQKSFYDHILRSEEEIEKHLLYILENPIRKGFCDDWKEYKLKGSLVYNLDEWEPLYTK